jgi:predicted urease superfamily metal-dependent hydrolase
LRIYTIHAILYIVAKENATVVHLVAKTLNPADRIFPAEVAKMLTDAGFEIVTDEHGKEGTWQHARCFAKDYKINATIAAGEIGTEHFQVTVSTGSGHTLMFTASKAQIMSMVDWVPE